MLILFLKCFDLNYYCLITSAGIGKYCFWYDNISALVQNFWIFSDGYDGIGERPYQNLEFCWKYINRRTGFCSNPKLLDDAAEICARLVGGF